MKNVYEIFNNMNNNNETIDTVAFSQVEKRNVYHTVLKQSKQKSRKYRKVKRIMITACSAAAILAIALIICLSNPVMAKNLPLVGGLFERLQNDVSYFGTFSDKSTVLEESTDISYSKTINGLTVTFSEVYADTESIYLTMMLKNEEPFPDTFMSENDIGLYLPSVYIYFDKRYSFNDDVSDRTLVHPEGHFVDEHTYIGIIRFDLSFDSTRSQKSNIKDIATLDDFTLHLDVTQVIGEKATPQFGEEYGGVSGPLPNEYENYWFDGPWSFSIPITVDDSRTIVHEVNEINELGLGLENVILTPYELRVNYKYEGVSFGDTALFALDADGNRLPSPNSFLPNTFAIQDRDISTVDIYILDKEKYMEILSTDERFLSDEYSQSEIDWRELLKKYAKYHKTLHF